MTIDREKGAPATRAVRTFAARQLRLAADALPDQVPWQVRTVVAATSCCCCCSTRSVPATMRPRNPRRAGSRIDDCLQLSHHSRTSARPPCPPRDLLAAPVSESVRRRVRLFGSFSVHRRIRAAEKPLQPASESAFESDAIRRLRLPDLSPSPRRPRFSDACLMLALAHRPS